MKRSLSIGPPLAFLAIGHLLFLGLFILAFIHFLERTIHVDSAYQIFKWIQLSGVEVEAHRYSAILPQFLVKLGKGMGVGLSGLLLLASLAHVGVAYLIFLITAYVLRTPWIAAATALSAVLCTRLTFYGIVLEANYLLSYPLLLAAVIEGPLLRGSGHFATGLLIFALALVLLVHPVGFLIALFVIAWYFLHHDHLRKRLVLPLSLAVAWSLFGRVVFPPSPYEAGLYSSAGSGFSEPVPSTNAALDFLRQHSWQDTTTYLPLWLLVLTTALLLTRARAWTALGLFVIAVIGYVAINAVTYRTGETAMMMEKNFLPLAVLVAIPLAGRLGIASRTQQWWALAPFIVVLFIQFRGISFASREAKERTDHIAQVVRETRENGIRKAIYRSTELDERGFCIHWALPFETILFSSLDGPSQCLTAIAITDTEATNEDPVRSIFDEGMKEEQLDKRYFTLPNGPFEFIKETSR